MTGCTTGWNICYSIEFTIPSQYTCMHTPELGWMQMAGSVPVVIKLPYLWLAVYSLPAHTSAYPLRCPAYVTACRIVTVHLSMAWPARAQHWANIPGEHNKGSIQARLSKRSPQGKGYGSGSQIDNNRNRA